MKKKMFVGTGKLLFPRARELRNRSTKAEELLWGYLKTKPFGQKFRKQHAFGNYILDFYSHPLKLVIEIDGSIHLLEEIKINDIERQKWLEEQSLSVVRFSNEEIILHLETVINKIEEIISNTLWPKTNLNTPL